MATEVKITLAIILIILGFNFLAYGHVKRRIAAAKAEGYKREREAEAIGEPREQGDSSD